MATIDQLNNFYKIFFIDLVTDIKIRSKKKRVDATASYVNEFTVGHKPSKCHILYLNQLVVVFSLSFVHNVVFLYLKNMECVLINVITIY